MGESEDVVNEKKHVSSLLVSEVLGDGESGEPDSGPGTGGLVHLSVDKGSSALLWGVSDNLELSHFVVEIVSFSGPLSDSGEHRVTTVGLGDVVNQFHNKHGLSDSGSSEKSDLTSSCVRGKEIDDLDSGDQELLAGALVYEQGGVSMDGESKVGVDGAAVIDGLANNVDDSSEGLWPDGDHNGVSGVFHSLSSYETVGSVKGDAPDLGVSEMLGDLEHESVFGSLDLKGVEDFWEVSFELDIDNGTNDLGDVSASNNFASFGESSRKALVEVLAYCSEEHLIVFILFKISGNKSCRLSKF